MKTAKTLVIVTHPDIDKSVVNKRWVEELQKHRDLVTIHQLHEHYPDHMIDVAAEQQLLLDHDNIIFQFPFFQHSAVAEEMAGRGLAPWICLRPR